MVRALRKFRDKYTGKVYLMGEAVDATEERAAEMNAGKHGKLVEVLPEAPIPDEPPQKAPERSGAPEGKPGASPRGHKAAKGAG